jgi:hypothetical protein
MRLPRRQFLKVAGGCTDLDMATFGPGQVFMAAGVRIAVLSRSGETDIVEIRRS